jgi:hypothetical protein
MKLFQNAERWPRPIFDENDQPHFLFIITPPNSGSTALIELLNSSHKTMILQPRGEGQWLVPGLCEKDRWNPDKEVDYLSVKAVWLRKYQDINRLTQNVDVVLEKSPPNMMRMEMLSSQFKDFSFMANNRNPYAVCASVLYRHYDVEKIDSDDRKEILGNLAKEWVIRSLKIQELVTRLKFPLLTYEEFCHNPTSVLNFLNLPDSVSQSINTNANVKVKDYEIQPIINQNGRQISKLTGEEIECIRQVLNPNTELMAYFGY